MSETEGAGQPLLWHSVLGMRVDYIASADFVELLIRKAAGRDKGYVCSTDVNQCLLAHDDLDYRRNVIDRASYAITDSFYVNLARSLAYQVPRLSLMTAAKMMPALCEQAALKGIPVALIGGKDQSVLNKLTENLKKAAPGLQVVYSYSPPFRPLTVDEDRSLVEELNSSGARLTFIGLGCPKQERFMASHAQVIESWMIGVGAAFDYNAGLVRHSPPWLHKIGLEWLYRLFSDPRRLWRRYMVRNPRFILLTASEVIRRRVGKAG